LGASDATTRTERSRTATMKNAPLKSARQRGLWKWGQGIRLAHRPTAEQNQKKRTNHLLPKPDKLIRYRQIDRDLASVGTPHMAQFVPLGNNELEFFTVYDGD